MGFLIQILRHTPVWVYVLFVYLAWRGINACRPGDTSLAKLAVIPLLFLVWGLYEVARMYGWSAATFGIWCVAFLVGAGIGFAIVRVMPLSVDRRRGVIHRPADYTVLPLILLAFGTKYALNVTAIVSPQTLRDPDMRILGLVASGLFAGIFVGKFVVYARAYQRAPAG